MQKTSTNNNMAESFARVVLTDTKSAHLELGIDELERLLTDSDVADLPAVVVAVAGGSGVWRSFLLRCCVRFLEHLEVTKSVDGWMNPPNEPHKHSVWRDNSAEETAGIQLWGNVFKAESPKYGPVAVVLMETNVSLDNVSTMGSDTAIFSMSMLLSSVYVYNVSKELTERDLQNLTFFSEYASIVSAEYPKFEEVFQMLLFLVGDWQHPEEKPFGWEGGKDLLRPWIQSKSSRSEEQGELQLNIKNTFESLECFLMPSPAENVEWQEFKGKLSDLLETGKHHLDTVISFLLRPEMLIPKQLSGRNMTCRDFVSSFQVYFPFFKNRQMPQPIDLLNATAFVYSKSIHDAVVKDYTSSMVEFIRKSLTSGDISGIQEEHEKLMKECLSRYESSNIVGINKWALWLQLVQEISYHYSLLKGFHEALLAYRHEIRLPEKNKVDALRDYERKVKQLKDRFGETILQSVKEMAHTHRIPVAEVKKRDFASVSIWIQRSIFALLDIVVIFAPGTGQKLVPAIKTVVPTVLSAIMPPKAD